MCIVLLPHSGSLLVEVQKRQDGGLSHALKAESHMRVWYVICSTQLLHCKVLDGLITRYLYRLKTGRVGAREREIVTIYNLVKVNMALFSRQGFSSY